MVGGSCHLIVSLFFMQLEVKALIKGKKVEEWAQMAEESGAITGEKCKRQRNKQGNRSLQKVKELIPIKHHNQRNNFTNFSSLMFTLIQDQPKLYTKYTLTL